VACGFPEAACPPLRPRFRAEEPLKLADSQLEPVKWTELAGWTADDHLAAFAAYQTSCHALRKMRRVDERGRIYGALWTVCRNAMALRPKDGNTARTFFECSRIRSSFPPTFTLALRPAPRLPAVPEQGCA